MKGKRPVRASYARACSRAMEPAFIGGTRELSSRTAWSIGHIMPFLFWVVQSKWQTVSI